MKRSGANAHAQKNPSFHPQPAFSPERCSQTAFHLYGSFPYDRRWSTPIRMSIRDDSAPHQTARAAHNYSHELELAKTAALAAGEILRGYYRDGGYKVDQKSRDNPVTTADYAADR